MSESIESADSEIVFTNVTFGERVCTLLDQAAEQKRAVIFTPSQMDRICRIDSKEEMKKFLEWNGYPEIMILSTNPASVVRQILNQSGPNYFPAIHYHKFPLLCAFDIFWIVLDVLSFCARLFSM